MNSVLGKPLLFLVRVIRARYLRIAGMRDGVSWRTHSFNLPSSSNNSFKVSVKVMFNDFIRQSLETQGQSVVMIRDSLKREIESHWFAEKQLQCC